MNTLHFFLKENGKLYVMQEMPKELGYCHGFSVNYPCDGNQSEAALKSGYCLCHERMEEYNETIQKAKDNAIEVLNQKDVEKSIIQRYFAIGHHDFYSLEGCGIEITKILQVRHGSDWHDLPNQTVGRDPEGIYQHEEKALITFEEPKKEETLQTSNANKEHYIASTNVMTDGFDKSWLELWSEIEIWYGDIREKETGIQFLTRMRAKFNLSRK